MAHNSDWGALTAIDPSASKAGLAVMCVRVILAAAMQTPTTATESSSKTETNRMRGYGLMSHYGVLLKCAWRLLKCGWSFIH